MSVALVIGMGAKRPTWPQLVLDTEAVAARVEVSTAVVEEVVAGLIILGYLAATPEVDRRGRRFYRARLPA